MVFSWCQRVMLVLLVISIYTNQRASAECTTKSHCENSLKRSSTIKTLYPNKRAHFTHHQVDNSDQPQFDPSKQSAPTPAQINVTAASIDELTAQMSNLCLSPIKSELCLSPIKSELCLSPQKSSFPYADSATSAVPESASSDKNSDGWQINTSLKHSGFIVGTVSAAIAVAASATSTVEPVVADSDNFISSEHNKPASSTLFADTRQQSSSNQYIRAVIVTSSLFFVFIVIPILVILARYISLRRLNSCVNESITVVVEPCMPLTPLNKAVSIAGGVPSIASSNESYAGNIDTQV